MNPSDSEYDFTKNPHKFIKPILEKQKLQKFSKSTMSMTWISI